MPAITGQKQITTPGTAESLGDQAINAPLKVKALDTNTGVVVIGNDGAGDVTLTNGLRLTAGDEVTFEFVGNLASLMLDAEVEDEGVCWIVLNS